MTELDVHHQPPAEEECIIIRIDPRFTRLPNSTTTPWNHVGSKRDEAQLRKALKLLRKGLQTLDSQGKSGIISMDIVYDIQLLLENAEFYAYFLLKPTLNDAPIYGKYTIAAAKKFLALHCEHQGPSSLPPGAA